MSVRPSQRRVHDASQSPATAGALATVPGASTLWAMLAALRPQQWSKNGLVLLALVFSHRLTDPAALGRVLLATLAFCFAASAVYVLNDVADRRRDRLHPTKRMRPIASGQVSVPAALGLAAACATLAVAVTLWLALAGLHGLLDPFARWGGAPVLLFLTLAGYLSLNIAYSFWLKHEVLWDVFIIAAGFVLRALFGAFAIPVPISPWFYLCTTFLALLLALGKRRAELLAVADGDTGQRDILRRYTVQLLDQLLVVAVTCTLITYSLYTFQAEGTSHTLMVTIPFVVFGVFRYLYLLYVRGDGERPDELLWRDRQILGSVMACAVVAMVLIYIVPR
ncbi:MAG TPA: decaprenyl-phosphate phosphoribosyltransferase [Ktedonobacterales bacterium]|nr:decaprenyl-phosphate phosphoribosyltransferase [Ktedonobacterales bacterium]